MSGRYAIVLAGGRSTRMGLDKGKLLLDGRSLVARAIDACRGRDLVVVVAAALPADVPVDSVLTVLEDPPFGGPVAGLAAGLAALPSVVGSGGAGDRTGHGDPGGEVLVLACDLPAAEAVVQRLDAGPLGPDGTCLVDAAGFPQYLAARYRRPALAAAIPPSAESRDRSVRRVLGGLELTHLPAGDEARDVDTPAEATAAGIAPGRGD